MRCTSFFQSMLLRCYHETLTLAVCREMDNLELTLINQEIVERINFWRLHVLNLEDFADDTGIPISQDLRAVCRLCDGYESSMLSCTHVKAFLHAYDCLTLIHVIA